MSREAERDERSYSFTCRSCFSDTAIPITGWLDEDGQLMVIAAQSFPGVFVQN